MKIAIHHRSGSFSDRWINYCKKNNLNYKQVNCYETNIIEQLQDCNVLMWHYHHKNYKDKLFAKQLMFSLEHTGIKVFPDFKTAWHFDDKVGQKYLLEAIDIPFVPTFVFYEKKTAIEWVRETTFPKVFKLRGGAGASNVSLVNSKQEAFDKINIAFGRGFSQFDRANHFKEQWRKFRAGHVGFKNILKGTGRLMIPTKLAKMVGREKGYIYFQEFIAHNDFDIRVIVVGGRAFALKRMTRKNDFRASGSGEIIYEKSNIDLECIKISFDVNRKIKAQSIAIDFVFNDKNKPLLVEISYGFSVLAYDLCPGYWDYSLNWHEENFNPQEWMIENLINSINSNVI